MKKGFLLPFALFSVCAFADKLDLPPADKVAAVYYAKVPDEIMFVTFPGLRDVFTGWYQRPEYAHGYYQQPYERGTEIRDRAQIAQVMAVLHTLNPTDMRTQADDGGIYGACVGREVFVVAGEDGRWFFLYGGCMHTARNDECVAHGGKGVECTYFEDGHSTEFTLPPGQWALAETKLRQIFAAAVGQGDCRCRYDKK